MKNPRLLIDSQMVYFGPWRVSVLTSMLLRLEYSPEGRFEDRKSQIVINRNFEKCGFTAREEADGICIRTPDASVWLEKEKFGFSALQPLDGKRWHYGQKLRNLGGTARTLDGADGAIPLEDGIFSREGLAVLEDDSCVLQPDGEPCQRAPGTRDFYLFSYGREFTRGLQDFYRLCGETPLIPRFALGNWWSRYWPYSEGSYLALMERFARENLPFSVSVIDMDWHLTQVPEGYNGWTGYTWNRALFPDPAGFLRRLHDMGKRVTLNLHPAEGIQPFEESYAPAAEAMGLSPESGQTIPFDFTDPKFRQVYFDILLRPMEREGVDFWWIDWQQGTDSKIPGLDPLWLLNHYQYLDAAENGKYPLILSRYAGPGSHRYPLGFSGDTIVSWESLRFQPYFTSTAANIGYGWWSHDIGGHTNGVQDDELICRWVQLGVFSPINRLHSTKNCFAGKEPWNYRGDVREIMGAFLRLRHKLVPYLHSMNYRSHLEGIPLVRPMYHVWPHQEEAYDCPGQFVFGSQMLVSPVVTPMDPVAVLAETKVWLPEGEYYDFFTGVGYTGGRWMCAYRSLSQMPVFVKAGGIVPMGDAWEIEGAAEDLQIFPGADGHFTLYEDDGRTNGQHAEIAIDLCWASKTLTIHGTQPRDLLLPKRRYRLHLRGIRAAQAAVTADGMKQICRCEFDGETCTSVVQLPAIDPKQDISVQFSDCRSADREIRRGELFRLLQRAQVEYNLKERVYQELEENQLSRLPECAAQLPAMLTGAILELLR